MPGPGRPFQPGESGNPKGRPPKSRALTEILNRAGSRTIEVNGQKMSGRRFVARALWELATTGQTVLPGREKPIEAGPQAWLDVVKFLYAQIDGPPKSALEVTGKDGAPLTPGIITVIVHKDTDADGSP